MALTKPQVEMLPAGTVLQVVNAMSTTYQSTSSSTWSDVGLSVSITPKFATSKVLVVCCLNGVGKANNTNSDAGANYRFADSSNNEIASIANGVGWTGTATYSPTHSVNTSYLHSPNTTGLYTYKVQFSSFNNRANGAVFNWYDNTQNTRSFITLLEIAA